MIRSLHDNIPLRERLQQEKHKLETLWRDFDTVLRINLVSPAEQHILGELLVDIEDTAQAIGRLLAVNANKKASDRE